MLNRRVKSFGKLLAEPAALLQLLSRTYLVQVVAAHVSIRPQLSRAVKDGPLRARCAEHSRALPSLDNPFYTTALPSSAPSPARTASPPPDPQLLLFAHHVSLLRVTAEAAAILHDTPRPEAADAHPYQLRIASKKAAVTLESQRRTHLPFPRSRARWIAQKDAVAKRRCFPFGCSPHMS